MTPHALHDPDSPQATSASSSPPFPSSLSGNAVTSHLSLGQDAGQDSDEPYDVVGIGFGPANLALAIALHDALESSKPIPGLEHLRGRKPRVLFLERQPRFAWHEGMLLPGTKMQISFVKDLATLRDPRSQFTFLNYLHSNNRLVQFTNLDTFLPQRIEYQDYMKWCAGHFSDIVRYGQEVTDISPATASPVTEFQIGTTDITTGKRTTVRARHAVIAIGGRPSIPKTLPQKHARVLHSSRYAIRIASTLPDPDARYRIAVLGGGQSAAEVFNDLHSRYPNAETRLIVKGAALKPSDDSPFVNEIFDPERVNGFYEQSPESRERALVEDRATNYGVVRLGLLEHIYETLYTQRIQEPNESRWQHRIMASTAVVGAEVTGAKGLRLQLADTKAAAKSQQTLDVDAVVVAAGYSRDVHESMLEPCRGLMGQKAQAKCDVGRDYGVQFDEGAVSDRAGVWLQGCNERTHGLSDTLLSILATRGGEMVRSLFGDERYAATV